MNRFAGLRLLGPYLNPYRGRVALALLSLLVAAGTVLAFGACLRALIDRGFAQGNAEVLNYALASLLVVALVLAIASGARFYLVSWLGERVVGNLRKDLFEHVLRLGPAWFEVKRSGDVMSRISADAQLIEQVIGSSASVALRNTLMCLGGIVMLVITNPKLALFTLASLALFCLRTPVESLLGASVIRAQKGPERQAVLLAALAYGSLAAFALAALFWGVAGFVVGDVLAWQLAFPALNFDLPWTSFGRLRPLHTSAVIFAFGGNVLLDHAEAAGRQSERGGVAALSVQGRASRDCHCS